MGACAGRDEVSSSIIPALPVMELESNGATDAAEADVTVKAREGGKLGAKELQLLGKYDEVGEQGQTKRKYYKKRGGDIYLFWCDGRTGAKYSDAWWFSRKTDGTDCLSFCPEKDKGSEEHPSGPPAYGWQGLPNYFFQAPAPTPIHLTVKGPPPPPGVIARVESCGQGCFEFLTDVKDAIKQRNKSKENGKVMQMVQDKVALAKGKTAEAREKIQDHSAKMYAKASERYPETTAKAEEKYQQVRRKTNDAIDVASPIVRKKTEDAVEIARSISASSAELADKAKIKAKEAAQDFQENQLPVIKQKTSELVEQYGPVVADNVSNACSSICDCLSPQPGPTAKIADGSNGAETTEAPAPTTQAESSREPETKGAVYTVTFSDLPVNKTKERTSEVVGKLATGSTVIVLEFAEKKDKERVRARIESPAGWITAWMADKSSIFIEAPKSSKQLDKLNPYGPEEFQRRKIVFEEESSKGNAPRKDDLSKKEGSAADV